MLTAMVLAKAYSFGCTCISRGCNHKCHGVLRFSILEIGVCVNIVIRPGDTSNGFFFFD